MKFYLYHNKKFMTFITSQMFHFHQDCLQFLHLIIVDLEQGLSNVIIGKEVFIKCTEMIKLILLITDAFYK